MQLSDDEQRVDRLFDAADAHGVVVRRAHVKLGTLVELLQASDVLLIALVDVRHLQPTPTCQANLGLGLLSAAPRRVLRSESRRQAEQATQHDGMVNGNGMCKAAPLGYTGHYIVVCGYDRSTDTLRYRDPASKMHELRVPLTDFERARCAHGTDEDLLIVRAK